MRLQETRNEERDSDFLMFLLYNFILTLTAPFWVVWMLLRVFQRKEKPIWQERFGNYPFSFRRDRKRIWFHAVSVGEVVACLPVLREIRSQLPGYEIVLSVTTSSGHHTAREHASDLYDHLVYFPIDVARFMQSAMQQVQPAVVAIFETELWMNFLWAAKTFRARTLLVNGRISDRSFPRAMLLRPFYAALLRDMDECLMQTKTDAERISMLGGQNVSVLGNVKFDQATEGSNADPEKWRKALKLPDRLPVIVVGSTRGEEEERLVIDALVALPKGTFCVVHAPRHLERVPSIAKEAGARLGGVGLRSKGQPGSYIILDTYGELAEVYSIADVVVVGGGFEDLGGQNILQPLAHGKPVIHGPHMDNFRDIAAAAAAAGATRIASNARELAQELESLLADPNRAGEMGKAASEFVAANIGASKRYAAAIAAAALAGESEINKTKTRRDGQ